MTVPGSSPLRWTPYRLGVVLLVVVAVAFRAYSVGRWSWQDDDWRLMHWAVSRPFGSYYLTNYSGHVLPGGFLLTWVVTTISPLDHVVAVAFTAVASGVGVGVWALAFREMFGERLRLLIPLALLTFTPLAMRPQMWWTAALLMLPLHLATGLCVYFTARYARRHDRGSVVGVVLSLVGGLLFWEKALLVVIPVVGVLLFCSDLPVRRTLRRAWPLLVSVAATVLAYLVLYRVITAPQPGEEKTGFDPSAWPGLGKALDLYREVVTQALLPAALGGPWGTTLVPGKPLAGPSTLTVLVSGLLVLLLVAAAVVVRRRAWVPLAMVAGYALVATSLVLFSNRVALFGDLAVREDRYTVDIVAVGALAAAMLVTPRTGERSAWRRALPRRATAPADVGGRRGSDGGLPGARQRAPGAAGRGEPGAGVAAPPARRRRPARPGEPLRRGGTARGLPAVRQGGHAVADAGAAR